jgi:hypothetical protein
MGRPFFHEVSHSTSYFWVVLMALALPYGGRANMVAAGPALR